MKTDSTEICGLRIRFGVAPGKANKGKLPLLICSGLAQSIETMEAFAKACSDRDVILFDAPGVGKSDVPVCPLTMQQHGEVAVGLLDAIGCRQADVMGLSWGGALALKIAYAHPDRCRRLILAVTAPGGLTIIPGHPGLMFEMAVPTRYFSSARRKKMVPKMAGGDAINNPALILNGYERNTIPRLWGYYSQTLAVRFWTSIHWLRRLKQPTLVLSGEKDPVIPPINQKILARLIPDSEFRSYDCGHFLTMTRQDKVISDIQVFLNAKSKQAA